MSTNSEMLRPGDKPALVAVTTPEFRGLAQTALLDEGFKVHCTETHEDCLKRFAQIQYQVVVCEEAFAGSPPGENTSMKIIQSMAMPLRRHATIVLLGSTFKTLDPMQAFVQSVHAVVNTADLDNFRSVLQRVTADTDGFLSMYRESQTRQAHGK